MKLSEEVLGETFARLFKSLQPDQSLDVFKLTHGLLWVLCDYFVDVAVLFHEIFKIGLEKAVGVEQSGSDRPFRDS